MRRVVHLPPGEVHLDRALLDRLGPDVLYVGAGTADTRVHLGGSDGSRAEGTTVGPDREYGWRWHASDADCGVWTAEYLAVPGVLSVNQDLAAAVDGLPGAVRASHWWKRQVRTETTDSLGACRRAATIPTGIRRWERDL